MSLAVWILVMAGVTYSLRVIPLLLIKREITSVWWQSFLLYLPYAVLTAMTVPAMVLATRSPVSGLAALIVASLVAMRGRSLGEVTVAAAGTVVVVEALLGL
ncbi:branched-subunit amino acid transport protein AzlD [Luteococcus japonicus]|uniref:Branched-subunit amino acid transport protein AzlD n=1 Tax=Luteococcus japonicus TaxID=33984 RepID=A0A3N1ZRS6_9ACTN|nr:AzlD domain-containing protein [Luteococcus japonicus]ROR53589.1 branched-subunit amino acid transport protein AzlD [Luteococcus japonicus]